MMSKKLKKNTQKHTTIFLPHEVIEIILSRLPVKSLLRFKTVSKSWKATISDPRFSKKYNIQQSKSKNLFFLWRSTCAVDWPLGGFSLIKLEDKIFRSESELGRPFEPATAFCSCNGMVLLLFKWYKDSYVLWNPSIRNHIIFTGPSGIQEFPRNSGLYYDPTTDDYKVVTIYWTFYSVFSCKSQSWGWRQILPSRVTEIRVRGGVFVDGAFYWWLRDESHNGQILCFDAVGDKKLEELRQPNDLKANNAGKVRLIILSGRLCLYHMDTDWVKCRAKLQLWVMEKHGDQTNSYCWRELMNTERCDRVPCFYKPICLRDEDNVVIVLLPTSMFVIYNHREKKFEESQEFPYDMYDDLLQCSESLYHPADPQWEEKVRDSRVHIADET